MTVIDRANVRHRSSLARVYYFVKVWLRDRLQAIFYFYEVGATITIFGLALLARNLTLGLLTLVPVAVVIRYMVSEAQDISANKNSAPDRSETPGSD